jgi:hypothetical protein
MFEAAGRGTQPGARLDRASAEDQPPAIKPREAPMDASLREIDTGRRLNHVEYVHRPGEAAMVLALFEALGCASREIDTPPYGKYVVVDLDGSPHGVNDMFVSQAEPEQLALEEALGAALADGRSPLGAAAQGYRRLQQERPFRATHVGLRVPSVRALDAVVGRLQALRAGPLAGRLELGGFMSRSPEEALAMSAPLKQLWVWTDVFSTGLLTLGQQIELQAYEP